MRHSFLLGIDPSRQRWKVAAMHLLPALIAAVFVPVVDWGMSWRISDFYSDYRYWPLSPTRLASIIMLALAGFATVAFGRVQSQNPAGWTTPVIAAALVIWGIVRVADIAAHRRTGSRLPPTYSEPDG